MIERINEILKNLKPKEKMAIIISMSALAVVLITVVLLLAFCGKEPNDKIEQHNHNYNGCHLKYDEASGKFYIEGVCGDILCGEREIRIDNVDAKQTSVSCTTKTYSYTIGGATLDCVVSAPGNHKLNGQSVDKLLNPDGSINYDVPGVKKFSNVKYVCNGTVAGYYECEDCKETVQVQVYRPHVPGEETIITVFPTCDTTGKQAVVCDNCQVVLSEGDEIPALGHAYKFTLKQSGGSSDLIGKCERKGCDNPDFLEKNVSGLTLVEEIPSVSCATPGKKIYKYTNKDGKTVDVTVIDENTKNHTLNGVDATTLMDENGYYAFNVNGIRTFSGAPAPCGEITDGMYRCEVCDQLVKINITKPAHSVTISGVVNPTKTEAGHAFFKCKNDGCDLSLPIDLPKIEIGKNATVLVQPGINTDEVIKYYTDDNPLGYLIELEIVIPSKHDHVYSYTIEEKDGKTNLIGKCVVEFCSDPDHVEEGIRDLKVVNRYPANCQEGERVEYSCLTAAGKTITFSIVEGEKVNGHYLNGSIAKGDVMVNVEIDGVMTPVSAFTYKGGSDGIKIFASSLKPGETVSGYYKCDHCEQLVTVYVFIPADYVEE